MRGRVVGVVIVRNIRCAVRIVRVGRVWWMLRCAVRIIGVGSVARRCLVRIIGIGRVWWMWSSATGISVVSMRRWVW